MLQKFKDYFFYTRTERNGLLLLVGILLLLVLSLPFFALVQPKPTTDFTEFEAQINAFHQNLLLQKEKKEIPATTSYAQAYVIDMNTASREDWLALGLSKKQVNTLLNYRKKGGYFTQIEDLTKIYGIDKYDLKKIKAYLRVQPQGKGTNKTTSPSPSKPPIQLAFFNPNTADKELLLQVGIPPRVVSTMLNYREKGGHFRKKKDLLKIFGLSQSTYHQIEPYLVIDAIPKQEKPLEASDTLQVKKDSLPSASPEKELAEAPPALPVIIDINTTDPLALESLKGIGPYYSKQIIKYRDQLGGFTRLEQIKETYNFPDSTFQNIKNQLTLSPITRQIKINECSAKELSAHPYISWRQAKVIINYRKMHGSFHQSEELVNIRILDEKTIQKITPYLQFK